MADPGCPVCGAAGLPQRYALPDGASLASCPACDVLVRREPADRAVAPSWDHYDAHLGEQREDTRDYIQEMAGDRLGMLRGEPGRLLEVGPASGEFLTAARAAGWTCEGLEPAAAMAKVAREASGCTVHELPFERFHPERTYDWIVMWHVFEHLRDPARAVQELARLLSPGGHLAVVVPNRSGWMNRLLGARAPSFGQVDHLFLYPPGALAKIISTKFEIETVRTHEPIDNLFSSFYQLAGQVKRAFASQGAGAPGASSGGGRRFVRRLPIVLGRALAPLTWPFRRLAEACGGGHEVWLVARKRAEARSAG